MSKVDKCICCKEIGAIQAESETRGHLCITESSILIISMCEHLQYVEQLDDNQPPHEIVISLLILKTKQYGIKISKFNFINFLSTTNKIV